MQRKALAIKEEEIREQIEKHLNENDMSGVKIITIEYSLDGSQLFLALNSENSVHYNLKRLHQDIQKMVKGVHLEIRQIGPRDAAKVIQGMGACGLEKRCCSQFLTDFSSISIRMAKTQDISLTPSEITGMCGRLRCCLAMNTISMWRQSRLCRNGRNVSSRRWAKVGSSRSCHCVRQ